MKSWRQSHQSLGYSLESFRKRDKPPIGISWRMDDKVKGQWVYFYRGVDKEDQTVDFMLSEKRDEPAARAGCQNR